MSSALSLQRVYRIEAAIRIRLLRVPGAVLDGTLAQGDLALHTRGGGIWKHLYQHLSKLTRISRLAQQCR
jgi:hypothetical protein